MNDQAIKTQHLEKTAFVYLRQSTLTQVKRNVESGRRQRGMIDRVQELGWPATQIEVLDGAIPHHGPKGAKTLPVQHIEQGLECISR